MRILILGGTGTIGAPIVREFVRAGHDVLALARSERSAHAIATFGATPIPGDITIPDNWVHKIPPLGGLIHVAGTFADDEAITDQRLLDHLLPHLAHMPGTPKLIYTGGCWLYGESKTEVTTEESPFDPLPAFAWTVRHIARVFAQPGVHPVVIHPAMVYEPTGGVFKGFYDNARAGDALRVVGSPVTRWPLVHADDLATLYRIALEQSAAGETYIGAAIDGIAVGTIVQAYARHFHMHRTEPEIIGTDTAAAELGEWARGYALNQVQSGKKARQQLGWKPQHLDPVSEIEAIS